MSETFGCSVGLSDHSFGFAAAVAAVALGATVIEKHLTLSRADGGTDSQSSMEQEEFSAMCCEIRMAEKALGRVTYDLTLQQEREREHSRSLFVVEDIEQGDVFTPKNEDQFVRFLECIQSIFVMKTF